LYTVSNFLLVEMPGVEPGCRQSFLSRFTLLSLM
jgi:hypothetical protein